MYKVIHFFTDLQDNDHPYNVGDVFPRQGKTVSDERIAELAGSENKQRTPLIEAVDEPIAEVTAEDTTESAEGEEKPKRTRKRKS